jgi:hypothetical protein
MQATTDKDTIIERVRGMEPSAAKGAVYRAMKSSYQVMYDNMMSMLEPALSRYEISYYRDIAMAHANRTMRNDQLQSSYRPSAARLGTITTAVSQLNDRIMHQWK